ncbi:MAG TPA: hypothetical protein DCQ06_06725 [Myxococcales bacterium]|nr:hypothetical protein [Myxococcales bacterium]HAN31277.1 hypothetical protein [Myxococcales bacterium]
MKRKTGLSLLIMLVVSACQPNVPLVSGRAESPDIQAADDATFQLDGKRSIDGWPTDGLPPTITLELSPDVPSSAATFVLRGQVVDDTGVASAQLQVGSNVAVPLALQPDGRFEEQVLLPYGEHTLRVSALDIGGIQSAKEVLAKRIGAPQDKDKPTLVVQTPAPGFEVNGSVVLVQGKASDDVAVTEVRVQVNEGPEIIAQTQDFFAHWRLNAGLSTAGKVTITVRARDASGKLTTKVLSGSTTQQFDLVPPILTITSPQPGASTLQETITLSGSAQDASGIATVQVRVNQGPYLEAQSSDGYASFSLPLALQTGSNLIKVRARDKAGLVTDKQITVLETSAQLWSPAITVPLRVQPNATKPQDFVLTKKGLNELFPPQKARQIVTLDMSVDQLIKGTLEQIRNACGPGWQKANSLDKKCPKAWGQAEINLWRLVTMTPANVKVAGTSIAGMSEIAQTLSQWGLMDSFSTILAAGLGIKETGLIVGSDAVADSMVANLVATHPNTASDGSIRITLEDCLKDLKTLASRYGPAGKHPGFLDPTSPPFSVVMTDDFEMKLKATSNLKWHDGLRLGVGKSYLALVQDNTGPSYDDVLEFNFIDPDSYQVSGLAAAPVVDLAFRITESPEFIPVGSSRYPLPKGNSKAWGLDPWTLEYALIDASWRYYKNHRAGCSYCSGKSTGALLWEVPVLGLDEAELVVGRQGYSKGGSKPEHFKALNPNPAGWLRVWTLFGLGTPPPDQYVWDMILGVSQKRLTDGGIKQGQGSVRFELKQVPVGLTGDDLKAKLKPSLQAQRKKLADLLMGPWKNSSPLDIFVGEGANGKTWLMFVANDDPLPKGSTDHPKRGFFADAKLTQKLSSTASQGSGDSQHEKLAWPNQPQTVYVGDVNGALHRLQLNPQADGTLWVTARKWVGAGQP